MKRITREDAMTLLKILEEMELIEIIEQTKNYILVSDNEGFNRSELYLDDAGRLLPAEVSERLARIHQMRINIEKANATIEMLEGEIAEMGV